MKWAMLWPLWFKFSEPFWINHSNSATVLKLMQKLLAEVNKMREQPLRGTAFESRYLAFTLTATNLRCPNKLSILTFRIVGISDRVHLHWRLFSSNNTILPVLAMASNPKQMRQKGYFSLNHENSRTAFNHIIKPAYGRFLAVVLKQNSWYIP